MRMSSLPKREDPTGFLNLFRLASMDRFGDPSGYIQGRGRWHHGRKKGPGRRHDISELPKGAKLRSEFRKSAVARNPIEVHEYPLTAAGRVPINTPSHAKIDGVSMMVRWVEQLPVRMKLPRLRRCVV